MNYVLSNTHTNVKLGIGKLPGRKQECFYFTEDEDRVITPIAYIRKGNLVLAKKLWDELTEDVPVLKEVQHE